MAVAVSEKAAKLLRKTISESALDPDKVAVEFTNQNGNLGIEFVEEFAHFENCFGLKVVSLGIYEDIVVDYYSSSDGREGIIYLGKEEYANYVDPKSSDRSQEGSSGTGDEH